MAKLACRCDGRCSKATGVPSSTQAPAKLGRMQRGAISEWPSYVIIRGHQRSSEVAITSFEHEDAREEMEQRQQPMRDGEQCRMT